MLRLLKVKSVGSFRPTMFVFLGIFGVISTPFILSGDLGGDSSIARGRAGFNEWELVIYILCLGCIIYFPLRWRVLQKNKRRLEREAFERTRERDEACARLDRQSKRLAELNRNESQLFSEISEQFRTPLTLIMGPLEQLIDRTPESELLEKYRLMMRNSRQLLNLINRLLELSRAGSGTSISPEMPLQNNGLLLEPIADPWGQEFDRERKNKDVNQSDEHVAVEGDLPASDMGVDECIVLVVENNPDIRNFIRTSIRDNYRVEEARDGAEGLEKAKNLVPDLIVSDVTMPRMDGYELCERLKKDMTTSHIPVVMLTAKTTEDSALHGYDGGADAFVPKPFSPRILMARIRDLIEHRRQLQQKVRQFLEMKPSEIPVTTADDTFLKDLKKIIDDNLSDQDLNVEFLAEKLYMSHSSLYRKIQAITGETPKLFIRSYRLQRAVRLLKSNFGNITEVAFAVGFSSTSYFSRCFKDRFKQSPSDFLSESCNDGHTPG